MLSLAGVCIVIATLFIVTVNAIYMLRSPSAWFRLPWWLRATGSLSQGRHTSGLGALAFESRVRYCLRR